MNIVIALALTFAAIGVAKAGFGYRIPGLAVLALYLALYFVVARLRRRPVAARYAGDRAPDTSHWPTSGPIGKLGQWGLLVPWTITNTLAILNPRQAVQVLRQVAGNTRLAARERASGDDGSAYVAKARYTLPFRDEWLVYNGGTTPATSHSWDVLGQRYALDFVVADERHARHRGRGTRPEEYLAWNRDIVAAADGVVVAAEGRVGTAPLLGWGVCDFTARDFVGNHVVVEHAAGEFALYAHLVGESVAVSVGERVARGQLLGRCGHSGHSSEPHLHFHLQDSADLFDGMGLPLRFSDVIVDGRPVAEAALRVGDRVRPASVADTGAVAGRKAA